MDNGRIAAIVHEAVLAVDFIKEFKTAPMKGTGADASGRVRDRWNLSVLSLVEDVAVQGKARRSSWHGSRKSIDGSGESCKRQDQLGVNHSEYAV